MIKQFIKNNISTFEGKPLYLYFNPDKLSEVIRFLNKNNIHNGGYNEYNHDRVSESGKIINLFRLSSSDRYCTFNENELNNLYYWNSFKQPCHNYKDSVICFDKPYAVIIDYELLVSRKKKIDRLFDITK